MSLAEKQNDIYKSVYESVRLKAYVSPNKTRIKWEKGFPVSAAF